MLSIKKKKLRKLILQTVNNDFSRFIYLKAQTFCREIFRYCFIETMSKCFYQKRISIF